MDTSNSLLFDLYACPTEPTRWTRVLGQLCKETGARSAVIQSIKAAGSRLAVEWSALDPYTREHDTSYQARISDECNPRITMQRIPRGLNRIARDEDLFDRGELVQHQLREQLAGLGLGRFVGFLQQIDCDTYLTLALHRAVEDRHDFTPVEVNRLALLAPHFAQAFGLKSRLQTAADIDQGLRQHLDRLPSGLIICNSKGLVHWMNRSAEDLLASTGTLRLLARNLAADSPAQTKLLMHEIGEAAVAGGSGTSRYLTLGSGARVLYLALQPMLLPNQSHHAATSISLVVTGATTGTPISSGAMMKLFGLTQAESCLAVALVAGKTLEQYAQHRGVSLGTVRGQVKQVLAKTGAARQSELVRLVLSSAAAQTVNTIGVS
jgi:DNA-binding CsgD family transcriptional regulator